MKLLQLILVILAACFLFSCNTAKHIEKKDQKYVGYILSKPVLTDQIYKIGLALHPVMPSNPIYVPGKTVTVIDSSFAKENIDRLNDIIADILNNYPVTQNIDSIRQAIKKEVERNCKPRIIDNSTTDTLKIADPKLLDAINRDLAFEKGKSAEKDKRATQLEAANNKTRWWLIGISVFSLLAITGLTYLIFKK